MAREESERVGGPEGGGRWAASGTVAWALQEGPQTRPALGVAGNLVVISLSPAIRHLSVWVEPQASK